ncbi:hypothetical protein CAEBREN_07166 [Caenorhabditis brenneri]|uniref:Uncharacterized protein n=1 Tax=Caenorhabditis brenneri TaxID=135651 RepID=G0MMN9_CAEBE|nr:hypothetical protein CAEBREN_07166 [Caenorhabditis brenneri]
MKDKEFKLMLIKSLMITHLNSKEDITINKNHGKINFTNQFLTILSSLYLYLILVYLIYFQKSYFQIVLYLLLTISQPIQECN